MSYKSPAFPKESLKLLSKEESRLSRRGSRHHLRRWAATFFAAGMLSVVPSAQAVDVPFFTPQVISNSADSARSVFAADVDSDGDTDILSASRSDNKIAWYENNGIYVAWLPIGRGRESWR